MVDPYLAAIVEAAEGGSKCPQLWMTLTSGDLVVGTPMASDIFISGTHKAVVHANMMLEGQQKISERRATTAAVANETVAHLARAVEPSQGRAITIADATVVRSGGDSAQMTVFRVNLDTVAGWRLVSAKFEGKTGTLVGVGIGF